MAELGSLARGQLEAGLRYPTTFPGVLNTYGGSTRDLAAELDAAEGRVRDPRSTQRSLQRYGKGERTPSGERLGRMRSLARGRMARRRLAPFRSRGAQVLFRGRVVVYTNPRTGAKSYRTVRFDQKVSAGRLRDALDSAETAMETGRGWDAAGDELIHATFDAWGSPLEEVETIDGFSIRSL